MSKKMCINCKHCIPDEDFETSAEGMCVYNPPVFVHGKDKGQWPIVWLNQYCSKWEAKEDE